MKSMELEQILAVLSSVNITELLRTDNKTYWDGKGQFSGLQRSIDFVSEFWL